MNAGKNNRKGRISSIVKILLMSVATIFIVFSFSSMGNSQGIHNVEAATANSYTDDKGNWMGGTADQHDAWLKDNVNSNWKGEAYAETILASAKGTDSTTGKPYIDEWMPDQNLQKLVVHYLGLSSVNDITKDLLKEQLTSFGTDSSEQHYSSVYYQQVINTKSLEGFQYATDLTSLELSPNMDASYNSWKVFPHGRLSDISALTNLDKMNQVNIQLDDVYDISPLAGKKLDFPSSMSYNHVTDATPLESSKHTLGTRFTFGFQTYKLPVITLSSKITSFTTPSFVIKNVEGANVPVKPYYAQGDPNPNFNSFAQAYKSTADGGPYSDPAKPQVVWTNLTKNNTINTGYMTVTWQDSLFGDPSYTYQGWIIQPYKISDAVGNVNVNFKNGENGQLIYGQQTLSGKLKDNWSLGLNGTNTFQLADTSSAQYQNIQQIITHLKEQYDFNQISVSTPFSGQYSDATPVPTVTYTFKKKAEPVVAKPVTVKYVDEANSDSTNNEIQAEKTINGNVNDPYDATTADYKPEYITNGSQLYKLDEAQLPTNATGTLGTTPITVTYKYNKVSTVNDGSSVIVHYIYEGDNSVLQSSSIHGKVGDSYQADGNYQKTTIQANGVMYTLDTSRLPDNIKGTFTDKVQTVNYYYKVANPIDKKALVIVNYIDEATNEILKSETISGEIGASYGADGKYRIDTMTVNGNTYNLDTSKLPGNTKGSFANSAQFVNYYYNKYVAPTPPVPPTPPTPPTPTPTPTPTPVVPTPVPDNAVPITEPATVIAKKGEAVYSLKKIYMYKTKDFKKSQRIASYAKKPRINRPMFVVTDYAKSKNGNLRYVVRDVNHHSKTDGMKGMITANWNYVRPVYYRSAHKTFTVINPRGVNEYKNKNLTVKVKNFKQGTVLKVKSFVKHNLTTRYLLSNGHYITGNRKLVISGKVTQPKQIKVKKTIYKYNNANFGKRISKVKKGTILKVKKWEYSQPYSLKTFGAKRYAVAGGYVTANKHFVKVIK